MIKLAGGEPANFLAATPEKIVKAFKLYIR